MVSMRFGMRSLFALTTGVAVCAGIAVAVPELLVPMVALFLSFLMAAGVVSLVTLIFYAEDRFREFLGRRRPR
jgi:hypothetical protein